MSQEQRARAVRALAAAVLVAALLLFISLLLKNRASPPSNSNSAPDGGSSSSATADHDCSGFGPALTAPGTFSSHAGAGYSPYGNMLSCSTTITAPAGSTITFALTFLDTERRVDTAYLYDGPSISSPLLATFSGATLGSWRTTVNYLTVRFSTDGSVTGRGFTAFVDFPGTRWSATATPTPSQTSAPAANVLVPGGSCGGPRGSFSSPGTFTSHAGAGSRPYGNGWTCTATITAPSGTVATFSLSFMDTEEMYDYVALFDGPSTSSPLLASTSGSALGAWTASSPTLTVRFTTDSSVTGMGFIAFISFGAAGGWSASATPTPSPSLVPLPSPVVCAAGSYASSPHACALCPANTFSGGGGAYFCARCSAGTWSAVGAAACTVECPAGTFSSGAGGCESCPAGTASVARSLFCTPCPPGSTSAGGAAVCAPCPAGTWSAACADGGDGGAACGAAPQCAACDAGKYSVVGAPSCAYAANTCPAGTFALPPASCAACAVGTFATAAGGTAASACLPCPGR